MSDFIDDLDLIDHGEQNTIAKRRSRVLPILTLVTGVIAYLLGWILYGVLRPALPRPLLIGLIFAALALLLAVVIFAYSKTTSNLEGNIFTCERNAGKVFLLSLAAVIVIFAAAALFQWIYGIDFSDDDLQQETSYIFLIDDSGSMAESDPNNLRYDAVQHALESKPEEFPFAVYGFAQVSYLVRDMAPIADGTEIAVREIGGGTGIRTVLEQVLEDYRNDVWDGGGCPRVVLLSDGAATDLGWFSGIGKILSKYEKAGITVSTVGLEMADHALMQQIADGTGGVYINVQDISQLDEAMKQAAETTVDRQRDLLSARNGNRHNLLYAVLRVVFLLLLGGMIGFAKAIAYGQRDSNRLILGTAAVGAVLGSLGMELGTGIGLPAGPMWLLLWLLLSVTPVYCKVWNFDDLDDGFGAGAGRISERKNSREEGWFRLSGGTSSAEDDDFDF